MVGEPRGREVAAVAYLPDSLCPTKPGALYCCACCGVLVFGKLGQLQAIQATSRKDNDMVS
jgi:hypothetical protein